MSIFGLFGPPKIDRLKASRNIKGLVSALNYQKQKRSDIRKAAAEALGDIQDEQAIQPLITALLDEDNTVQSAAVEALVNLEKRNSWEVRSSLIECLNGRYRYKDAIRQGCIDALVLIGQPAIKDLIELLPQAPEDAMKALVRIGSPVITPLVNTLSYDGVLEEFSGFTKVKMSPTRQRKLLAAKVLEKLDWQAANHPMYVTYLMRLQHWNKIVELGPVAIEALLRVAGTDEDEGKAIDTIFKIGTPAIQPLISKVNQIDRVEPQVIRVLGKFGDSSMIDLFIRVLQYHVDKLNFTNDEVAIEAAEALGQFAEVRPIEPLLDALVKGLPAARHSLTKILAKIGKQQEVVELLTTALIDTNRGIQYGKIAAQLLASINWQPMNARQEAFWNAHQDNWTELSQLGIDAIDPLILLINEAESIKRSKASEILASIVASQTQAITTDHLQRIALITDVYETTSYQAIVNPADETETNYKTEIIFGNSQIRDLAKQELLRRAAKEIN